MHTYTHSHAHTHTRARTEIQYQFHSCQQRKLLTNFFQQTPNSNSNKRPARVNIPPRTENGQHQPHLGCSQTPWATSNHNEVIFICLRGLSIDQREETVVCVGLQRVVTATCTGRKVLQNVSTCIKQNPFSPLVTCYMQFACILYYVFVGWYKIDHVEVLLYVHRNCRLIRAGPYRSRVLTPVIPGWYKLRWHPRTSNSKELSAVVICYMQFAFILYSMFVFDRQFFFCLS